MYTVSSSAFDALAVTPFSQIRPLQPASPEMQGPSETNLIKERV